MSDMRNQLIDTMAEHLPHPSDEEYANAADAIIAAMPDMVKPLVWVDHPLNGEPVISMAKSPFGTYFICDDTDDFTGLYCEFISHKGATWYGTVTASTVLICDHWHGDDHAPLQHQANTHHVATILAAFGVQGGEA